MGRERAEVRPIGDDDTAAAAAFLHRELNPAVAEHRWRELLEPPWSAEAPNHGFQLVTAEGIVGVYAAVYAQRELPEGRVALCNLAAFCVLEPYRADGLRLVGALLRQPGYEFTDLSPSGNVVALNERLGFVRVDTATRICVNLPALPRRGVRVTEDHDVIAARLHGADAIAHRDHRAAAAARHLLVFDDTAYAYVVVRRDRRKGLPLFATPLYAGGDRAFLQRHWPQVASRLLLAHGIPLTLAEPRILGFVPRFGRDQRTPRPKMIRSTVLDPDRLDYLYSELALIQW